MPLGSALAAGLDTFVGIRDYQRKERLSKLQEESLNLRNSGQRLDNTYSRSTLDTKVEREHSATEQQVYQTDTARIVNELEQKLAPITYQTAVHRRDTAGSNSSAAASDAITARTRADLAVTTFDSTRDATNSQNRAIEAESNSRLHQANQAAMFDAISPLALTAPSTEAFFAQQPVQEAFKMYGHRTLGPQIVEEYGEGASIAGFMIDEQTGDVVIGIDVDGDGKSDLETSRAHPAEVFAEVFGAEKGKALFAELNARGEQTSGVVGRAQSDLAQTTASLEEEQSAASNLDAMAPTVRGMVSNLAALKASLDETSEVTSRTGGALGMVESPTNLGNNTRRAQIQEEIDSIYAQAEEMGVSHLLGEGALDDAQSLTNQNVSQLGARAQSIIPNAQQQLGGVVDSYASGQSPEDVRTALEEQRDAVPTFLADAIEVTDFEAAYTQNVTNKNDTQKSLKDVQAAAAGKAAALAWGSNNRPYVEGLERSGKAGEQTLQVLLTRAATLSSKRGVPFQSAMDLLTNEHPELASELIDLHEDLTSNRRLRNLTTEGTYAQDLDRVQQAYIDIRTNPANRGMSAQAVKNRAIQSVMGGGRRP